MTERPAILIVEDDAATRTFLADNLTADGYDLRVARTLEEALRAAGARKGAEVEVGEETFEFA